MTPKKLDERIVGYWRLSRIIWLIIPIALAAAYYTILNFLAIHPGGLLMPVNIVFAVLIAMQLLNLLLAPGILYKRWEYLVAEDRVTIRRGLFFVTTTVIPIIRIQNVNMNQGPLLKHYGLHEVEIALASGTFEIPGLSREEAERITEYLNAKLQERIKVRGTSI